METRKKAIVTGASHGIGRGIARELAKNGYDLAVSYNTREGEALALKEELEREHGIVCHVFHAALEEPGAGVELTKKAAAALGGLDLLVNNAGVTKFENILEMTEETLDFLIALDFRNYLIMTREAARIMVENKTRGSIVNITSSRGERAYPRDGVYGGLKAGLNRAIQSFALDLAPCGIRVNNVAPGATRVRTKEEQAQRAGVDRVERDFWDELGEAIPLERSGTPEDIAKAVVFLASEGASYITGVTLRVDGGLILPGMPESPSTDGEGRGWGRNKLY